MAYEGNFKPYFTYIADSLKKFSSQRDRQKGEAYVHGFTLAMTSQCKFYRPISELDNEGGYADIFLSPLCDIYKDMTDSYIVELKYCKSNSAATLQGCCCPSFPLCREQHGERVGEDHSTS